MKKLVGSLVLAAAAALVACGGTDTGAVAPPADFDGGPAVDAARAPAARDAGPAPADASPPPADSRTLPPSDLAIDTPFAPGNQVGAYEATMDEAARVDGSATMLLASGADVTASSWAATTATIPVDSSHKGKRYRVRAKVKTEGAGGAFVWFRIDLPSDGWVIDNMPGARRLSGDNAWTEVSLVLDLPPKAIRFAFGSALKGAGRVWIGPITLESVDKTVPVTGG